MSKKRLTARVSGRVQGVSFRYTTMRRAQELGLVGWVRNELNGDVCLVAEGKEEPLNELLAFVGVGPSFARVDSVQKDWSAASGEFQRFQIER